MSLQDELQAIFDSAVIPDIRMNLDLAIALTDEKRKREKKLAAMRTWYEAAKMSHDDFERRVDGILEQFALSYFLETGCKTLVLPNGYRLSLREKADRMEITDEEAVVAWARASHPEMVREKYSVGTKALMEYFKSTGEVPDGTEFKAGEGMSFSCKDKGGKGGESDSVHGD